MNKKIIQIFFLFFLSFFIFLKAQKLENVQENETLNYRIHYGFLTAGSATLFAEKKEYNAQAHLRVRGVGRSSGAVRAFFKVDDVYESYINLQTGLPSYYIRNVSEGSYQQHLHAIFNHQNHSLLLLDKKDTSKPNRTIKVSPGIQDMLSAFYYLRGLDNTKLKVGSVVDLNVWIDDESFPFRLKVVGVEDVKTKFGKINCLKIIPSVVSGRVFKDKEGVTIWVSNDQNHIPISIKAALLVGSLKADLDSYKNVKYPLHFKK